MARRDVLITIDADGRDKGRVYKITEMSASQAEMWAARLLLAMAKSGVDLPSDIASAGMAGVAAAGVRALAGIDYADAKPLLDEMMGCVSYVPEPSVPSRVRGLIEDDIEEVATRVRLRMEVFKLHTGFSLPGA